MKYTLYLSILFLASCATNMPNASIPEIKTTQNDITIDDFKSHITYLSSDGLRGRSSGTPGDRMAKDYIVNHFTNAGLPTERMIEVQEHYVAKSRLKPKNKVKTYNIIATLPGKDKILKEEYVVIGGHYDSVHNTLGAIHNGADDNASGTSMVLELFEKFAASNSNKRTLVFMAFGGEELGLLGSKYFVNNPTIDLSKVQLMVNLDMVGRLDKEGKDLQLGGVSTAVNFSTILHPFLMQKDLNIIDLGKGIFSRSDHYSFYKKDIPVLFFFTGIHPDYHSSSDDADKINYKGMETISSMVNLIIEEFAGTSERLVFQPADEEEQNMPQPAKMKVTLGVMPDYAYDGDGLKIDSVIKKRAAQKAGLVDGDIVINIGDIRIKDIYDYMEILSKIEPGTKIDVKVLRDGEIKIFNVTF
ncbi:MAG: peptidase M28 [Candidatus Marinimicrobia bacterium]|nr:peptidase M28 [Candidatus Neomarinimicrobiota bacterium]